MSADITLSQAKRLHAMGAMDTETLASYVVLDRWRRKNRNVIAAQGNRDTILSALKEIATVEGSCSITNGVLSFEDGTTLDLCKLIDAAEGINPERYNLSRIAWELERTALGDGHYGNALRTAKDIPGVTDEERSLLDRYATGSQTGIDHVRLQTLALKIEHTAKAEGRK